MKVTVILAALLCVLLQPAFARPVNKQGGIGCSDPVMRPCAQKDRHFRFERKYERRAGHIAARAKSQKPRRAPPDLSRVMAEGAGRAVNWIKPRAWCGWWMRRHLGVANPAGNLARWWAGFGRPAHGPHVGALVIWARGHWHGHVGIITGRTPDGRWIVKSGNDGHRVRERPRSVAGAIAFRWPA